MSRLIILLRNNFFCFFFSTSCFYFSTSVNFFHVASNISNTWDTLCIDLIGPYTVKEIGKKKWTLHCLTMIDPATEWFEIAEIPSKQADQVANVLEQTWFSRYPLPRQVIHDRGTKFMAKVHEMAGLQIEYFVVELIAKSCQLFQLLYPIFLPRSGVKFLGDDRLIQRSLLLGHLLSLDQILVFD